MGVRDDLFSFNAGGSAAAAPVDADTAEDLSHVAGSVVGQAGSSFEGLFADHVPKAPAHAKVTGAHPKPAGLALGPPGSAQPPVATTAAFVAQRRWRAQRQLIDSDHACPAVIDWFWHCPMRSDTHPGIQLPSKNAEWAKLVWCAKASLKFFGLAMFGPSLQHETK